MTNPKRAAAGRATLRGAATAILLLLAGCYDPAGVARLDARGGANAAAERPEVYRTIRIEAGTHTDSLTDLAVDRAEQRLLTAGRDKTARLWSMADGAALTVLRPPIGIGDAGRIDAVALSPDGRLAALGGISAGATPNAVLLFDTAGGRLTARLERPADASGIDPAASSKRDAVEGLGFSDDGRRLGVRYRDGGMTAWFSIPDGAVAGIGAIPGARLPDPPNAGTLALRDGRRITVQDGRRLTLRNGRGDTVWSVAPAVPPVTRLDLSADGTVVRMNWPQGTQIFSAEEMDDDLDHPVAFASGPPAGRPVPLPDAGLLSGDDGAQGGGLTRRTRDGGMLWTTPLDSRAIALAASSDGKIVVAALGDGTLRWFGAQDGRERLALFFHPASDGWVAWTPGGFFDHSDNTWNYAGWHINRGPRHAADFVTIDQLYDVAYRPDLIRGAVRGVAEDVAAQHSGEAADTVSLLERGLPPAVALTVTPAADRRTTRVDAAIEEHGAGIGKVIYRLNGITVALDRTGETTAPGGGGTVRLTRRLPLRNGPNQIEVVALDAGNRVESAPALGTVTDGRGDGGGGALQALIVGIDRYQDAGMRLNYAVSDAKAIAAALAKQPMSASTGINIVQLLDADATTDAIARKVRSMAESMAQTDVFVLYLAGHGVNLGGNYQFITHDVQVPTEAEVLRHALSQDRLQELLAAIPADRAVVVLDTCYSGGVAERYDRNALMRTAHRRLARATGRGFLSAATSAQLAAEGFKGHGLLTAVLLDGLSGAAAPNRPDVSVRELGRYAQQTVPVIAQRQFKVEQKPVFSLVGRDFPLSHPDPAR